MAASAHCERCDLPKAQCVHGLEARQKKQTKKAAAKKTPAKKAAGGKSAFPAKPAKCARCGQRAPQGRYWMCSSCLLKTGALKCSQCKKSFKPEEGYMAKKPRCRSCRTKGKGSVWTVASAGSPGLGKGA